MATPKTGNPRGRPSKPYRTDRDRHIIALAQASEIVWGLSQNAAFDLTVSSFYGREAEHEKGRARQPADTQAVGWVTRVGPTPLQNRAAALITKAAKPLNEEDALHHAVLVSACVDALRARAAAKDRGAAVTSFLGKLACIGEEKFAAWLMTIVTQQEV
jgi:hypothetical protein